jgi:hypothetical protein
MRRLLSPATLPSRFGPCGLLFVPEVEILTKRSPISGGRGDRRKFDTEPSQNTFQDAFQKWKKRWERCVKSGGEYFEGDKFDYVVSEAINFKKIRFL